MFDIVSKLFERLIKTNNNCLEFTGALDTSRYGIVWKDKANKSAHIVMFEYFMGPIPQDMLVCHTCDNPPCCNFNHLFLGSRQDNYDDMVNKGRNYIRRGIEVNTAVFTENDILRIYELIDEGWSQRDIAGLYNVTHNAIGCINRGQSWAHLYKEHRQ